MNSAGQLVDFIHHVRCAYEYMQSFQRDAKGTKAALIGQKYGAKLEWIYKDLVTSPTLPQQVRDGLRAEWEVDTFATSAIVEKLALLRDDQRLEIEKLIEMVSDGQEIVGIIPAVEPNGDTDAAVGNVEQAMRTDNT